MANTNAIFATFEPNALPIAMFDLPSRLDMIDIKNKKCKKDNCENSSQFNYEGEKTRLYCSIHKLKDMISIVNKKCKEINCKKQCS